MVISILGFGWLGSALGLSLLEDGHTIKGSVTTLQKVEALQASGIQASLISLGGQETLDSEADFWNCDALVIASNVRLVANSTYTEGIKKVVDVVLSRNIKKTILISSTSVYGDTNTFVDEHSVCNPETASGKILLQIESLIRQLPKGRSTALRFGGLVGPGRYPGSFFAGKKGVANGSAPVNLIHLDDCIGVTKRLLQIDALPACLNAVSPDHPSKAEFYTLAAEVQNLIVPEFIPERQAWKIVVSKYQEEIGYYYQVDDWKSWLNAVRREL
jgi:nucleoside-diphosphate-sugar epimerase